MNAPNAEVLSVRNRRGTQREYETVLIVRPDFNKSTIMELISKIQGIFGKDGSTLLRVENWGLRTLAFPIKRNKRGIYIYTRYLGGSATVAELERNLRLDEGVVRYLTVKVDEDVDPSARPSEMTEEVLDAAGEIAPDPVEIARKQAEEEARQAAEEAAKAEAEAQARREAGEDDADGGENDARSDSDSDSDNDNDKDEG